MCSIWLNAGVLNQKEKPIVGEYAFDFVDGRR
jgi:hypothetical protein